MTGDFLKKAASPLPEGSEIGIYSRCSGGVWGRAPFSIKHEVLRYLGHKNQPVPPSLDKMIDECLDMMQQAVTPRQVHLIVPLLHGVTDIVLEGTGITLSGSTAVNYLQDCKEAAIMAATLGVAADTLIQKWQNIDLTRALILDACATACIESFCDETQQTICREKGRISPGYGDFPLETQTRILQVLNCERRIGLTCTAHHVMLPRKSVTAIIGINSQNSVKINKCDGCNMKQTCTFSCAKITEEL